MNVFRLSVCQLLSVMSSNVYTWWVRAFIVVIFSIDPALSQLAITEIKNEPKIKNSAEKRGLQVGLVAAQT